MASVLLQCSHRFWTSKGKKYKLSPHDKREDNTSNVKLSFEKGALRELANIDVHEVFPGFV